MHGTDGKDRWHQPVNATVAARRSASLSSRSTDCTETHGRGRKRRISLGRARLRARGPALQHQKSKHSGDYGTLGGAGALMGVPDPPVPALSVRFRAGCCCCRSVSSALLRVLCGPSSCGFHRRERGGRQKRSGPGVTRRPIGARFLAAGLAGARKVGGSTIYVMERLDTRGASDRTPAPRARSC
jgi:hypothetical protein